MRNVGWEKALEPYDCAVCGYPIDKNDRVYWWGQYDEPCCGKACALRLEPVKPEAIGQLPMFGQIPLL